MFGAADNSLVNPYHDCKAGTPQTSNNQSRSDGGAGALHLRDCEMVCGAVTETERNYEDSGFHGLI